MWWTWEDIVRRVLEALFGHRIQLALLTLIPLAVGLVVAQSVPRKYDATASVWALRPFESVGINGPVSDPYASPAQTQATVLKELLQTRSFALDVANQTDLVSTFPASTRANPQKLNDAIATDIATNVLVTPGGVNLYMISYTSSSPVVAQQVVAAVIHDFGPRSGEFASAAGQQLQQFYQSQMDQLQKNLEAAVAAEGKCTRASAYADPSQDPACLLLHNQTLQAQSQLAAAQSQLGSINSQVALNGTSSNSLFSVVDQPQVPTQPQSHVKALLTFVGGGAALGIIISALYIVILLRRDRTIVDPRDLERAVGQLVLLEVPALPKTSMLLLHQGADPVLLANTGRS